MFERALILCTILLISGSLACGGGDDEDDGGDEGGSALTGKQLYEGGVAPACTGCHGADGGPGAVSQADLTDGSLTASQMAETIRGGVPNTSMPAYDEAKLTDAQIDLIVDHLRSL